MKFIDLGLRNLQAARKLELRIMLQTAKSLLESREEWCLCNAVIEAGEIHGNEFGAVILTRRIQARMEVQGLESFDLYHWANKHNEGLKMRYFFKGDEVGRIYRMAWIDDILEKMK